MRKQALVSLAILAALAGQGCTVIGATIGGMNASNHNAERDARISAGFLEASREPPESVAQSAVGGGVIGFMIDAVLVGVAASLSNISYGMPAGD